MTASFETSPALRLSATSYPGAIPGVILPTYDRDKVQIGVVHFGPGAFHRAHQAFYFDALLETDPRWGVCAVSLKSPGVRDALEPQDGLYTLAQLDAQTTFRVIGAIREVLVADRDAPRKQRHTATRIWERLRDEHGVAVALLDVGEQRQAGHLLQAGST